MKLRYARHTDDLKSIQDFYTELLGLELLGGFEDHDHYDGIFLGLPGQDWHLEFTKSNSPAEHHPDPDDLLVFYLNSEEERRAILSKASRLGIQVRESQNEYWNRHGSELADPDGFGVILALRTIYLHSDGYVTRLARELGIEDWNKLLQHVRALPYGRNANRSELDLVIREGQGTCSSKHAMLKEVALENQLDDVKLILAMYKMNLENTPGIGSHIEKAGLDYLPEAHCYLKLNGTRVDLTSAESDIGRIERDILEEIEIAPEQVSSYKVDYHKRYIEEWKAQEGLPQSFEELWAIREKCIASLST